MWIPDEVTFEFLKEAEHPQKKKQQEQSIPKGGNNVHQKGQSQISKFSIAGIFTVWRYKRIGNELSL